MNPIKVEHSPDATRLQSLGVQAWPVWSKEKSYFPWHYDATETCLFLEGEVVVTPEGEQPVTLKSGDLVTFPAGMSCTWEVRKPVRKHFAFDVEGG
ncbi:MAG: cupin domain-containing protein [Magnetococcales bacterium]|nr:cupin domain-containing protein [Magnetococcales bacterium]